MCKPDATSNFKLEEELLPGEIITVSYGWEYEGEELAVATTDKVLAEKVFRKEAEYAGYGWIRVEYWAGGERAYVEVWSIPGRYPNRENTYEKTVEIRRF